MTGNEPTLAERAAWESRSAGLADERASSATGYNTVTVISSRAIEQYLDRAVKLIGVRLAAHRFRSANQTSMQLIDMDDQDGRYQVLWSGEALA